MQIQAVILSFTKIVFPIVICFIIMGSLFRKYFLLLESQNSTHLLL
jgi:hypothetical protein